jgi:hypothetical protein
MALAGVLLTSLTAVPAPAADAAPAARAVGAANLNYVASLYADLLDRTDITTADSGVRYWASVLDLGAPRTSVARAIQNASSEFYGGIVEFSYQRYLDRTADIGGFSYFVNGWRNKTLTLEVVTAVVVGSGEYFALHDSTNLSFVDAAYFDVLGRAPDSAGRNYFLVILAAYGRSGVAWVLANSDENRRNEIKFAVDSYLGRAASDAEVQLYLTELRNGVRREELDVQIVGSAEYYARNS